MPRMYEDPFPAGRPSDLEKFALEDAEKFRKRTFELRRALASALNFIGGCKTVPACGKCVYCNCREVLNGRTQD